MKTTMANLTHLLSDVSVWKSELHILSKMVYKKHAQRRREKTLQGLKRIKSCLERFCAFEGVKYLEDITRSLDSVDLDDNAAYLPSRQMLEFVLVRLMGMAALLTQTMAYCVHTFITVQHDLEIGILIPQSMLFLSIISRIWILSNSTCIYMVTWYNSLQKCMDHLEPTQVVWLEDPSILPVCLSKWLEKFEKKTCATERASVVMTELATPHANQKQDRGPSLQQAKTHGFVEEEPESILMTGQEGNFDDSEVIEEDLGSSVSRNDFASETNTNNKTRKADVVEGGVIEISEEQAFNRFKLANSLDDLLELVIKTNCQNHGGLYRNRCVKRLQKLMVMSQEKKQGVAKLLRKGQISVRKFLRMNTETKNVELSMIQDNVSQKQHKVISLEELKVQQDVRKMLLNFKRNHLIYLDREGRCLQIDDHQCAKIVQTALKKCMNRLRKNPDSAKQSINKAVKVVSSVVDQLQRDTSVLLEDDSFHTNTKQRQKSPCQVKGLDSNMSAKRNMERKKKTTKMSPAKSVEILAEGNIGKGKIKTKLSETETLENNVKRKLGKKNRKLNMSDETAMEVDAVEKVDNKKCKMEMTNSKKVHKKIPKNIDHDRQKTKRSSIESVDLIPKKKKILKKMKTKSKKALQCTVPQ
ncbi:uncharacterized protein LOC117324341 isoform X2 [Pecten maximus]|nr:uncharacterized protein LOC117324341 isoform X2 [Pecten maximus]